MSSVTKGLFDQNRKLGKLWVTSDTHFGHDSILKFEIGRSRFTNVDQMNEFIINQWNSQVSECDYVIHLGDVAWTSSCIEQIVPRLNGYKILVLGNHDTKNPSYYRD